MRRKMRSHPDRRKTPPLRTLKSTGKKTCVEQAIIPPPEVQKEPPPAKKDSTLRALIKWLAVSIIPMLALIGDFLRHSVDVPTLRAGRVIYVDASFLAENMNYEGEELTLCPVFPDILELVQTSNLPNSYVKLLLIATDGVAGSLQNITISYKRYVSTLYEQSGYLSFSEYAEHETVSHEPLVFKDLSTGDKTIAIPLAILEPGIPPDQLNHARCVGVAYLPDTCVTYEIASNKLSLLERLIPRLRHRQMIIEEQKTPKNYQLIPTVPLSIEQGPTLSDLL